jgi:hypothetical protein
MKKKGHHYTDKYLVNRQGYVDNYIIPEFGGFQPGSITRREIDDWLLNLKKKNDAELAGETKNKIMYTLSLIFEELRDLVFLWFNASTFSTKSILSGKGGMAKEKKVLKARAAQVLSNLNENLFAFFSFN